MSASIRKNALSWRKSSSGKSTSQWQLQIPCSSPGALCLAVGPGSLWLSGVSEDDSSGFEIKYPAGIDSQAVTASWKRESQMVCVFAPEMSSCLQRCRQVLEAAGSTLRNIDGLHEKARNMNSMAHKAFATDDIAQANKISYLWHQEWDNLDCTSANSSTDFSSGLVRREGPCGFVCLEDPHSVLGSPCLTGKMLWPGCAALLDVLETKSLHGASIVELGSGLGTLACFCASRGASVVAATDVPEALPLLQKNVEANGLQERVHVLALKWGDEPCQKLCANCPWDIVLMADVAYRKDLLAPLFTTARCLGGVKTQFWLAACDRPGELQSVREELLQNGFALRSTSGPLNGFARSEYGLNESVFVFELEMLQRSLHSNLNGLD